MDSQQLIDLKSEYPSITDDVVDDIRTILHIMRVSDEYKNVARIARIMDIHYTRGTLIQINIPALTS